MTDIITEHIDLWTSAIKAKNTQGRGSSKKRELYGVKKLRELILELAVRGKLVAQDSGDEPASVLLERIAAERERLVKDKKIKNKKPLLKIINKEKPFDLPNGWEWARLGSVGVGSTGKTPSTKESKNFDGDIPFLGPGQITPTGELLQPEKFLSEEGIVSSTESKSGDILMVCIGGSIGKSAICDRRIAFNQQINAISPIHIASSFLHCAVSTNRFYQSILDKSTGSATPIINRSKWEELLIPICPEQEQHRIVAKVDELMALCDQLEQQTESSLDAHNLLVDTLLATLTDAHDANELNDNWARLMATDGLYAGNAGAISGGQSVFDTLITTDYAVEQLKQTILQLAVQGKLVPQDPNDEPASELLKRIAAEKAQLVKNKEIKKPKPLPEITEEEKPFVLPEGWEWERFGRISYLITDGAHHTPIYIASGVPFLSVKDMSSGVLSFDDTKFISKEQHEELSKRCPPKKGDLLLTKIGTTGVPVIIDTDVEFSIFVSVALIKFPVDKLSGSFLSLLVRSPVVKKQSAEGTQGVGNKNLVLKTIATFKLAIPPLNEQHRIVAKVNELTTLCDQLKSSLNDAQTTQLHLADAVGAKALVA